MPVRIQRKRTRGWRMPEGVVYVGRPSKWGNPFRVDEWRSAKQAMQDFRTYVQYRLNSSLGYPLEALRGKDLACWCRLEDADGVRIPCHADVLLELANETDRRAE